ncbi:AAA family ATPase [Thioflexithrix psekupsensis]|uniref:Recombinase RecF n=1 Tax=Thioflexithrix psekupsensis TaxID=1570016 RepID=A0A251XBI5_9GAMM|nr:AAA family ATPase [Thioflexithrix psekupsensis]OUD15694.1 recombinase RecF [Thioflexithrix psekupsensis]
MKGAIKKISISGFKSIRELEKLEFRDLNIIIGANGAGKSNLVQIFKLLMAMTQKNFQKFILENGGADNFLHNGLKHTSAIKLKFEFQSHSDHAEGSNFYRCELTPTVNETFLISEERQNFKYNTHSYGTPSQESRLYDKCDENAATDHGNGVGYFVYKSISNWMVYHFHDTSVTAPMRRSEIVEDNKYLRHNGSNIAPFLLKLKTNEQDQKCYQEIVDATRLIIPFFDDFKLDIMQFGEAEKVKLSWHQKGSDFPMQPYHLSDGSIRFICLATALLQPSPPSTIVIDEPELGLHPEAIRILGELITDAAKRTQIVVATQSPLLIDQFAIEDILVVNRKEGQSTFERLQAEDFSVWLEEYSIGELWTKNVIQGGSNDE